MRKFLKQEQDEEDPSDRYLEPPSTYEACRDATMRNLQRTIDTLHTSSATSLTKVGFQYADGRSKADTAARQVVHDWRDFAEKTSARCADYWGQIQTLTEKLDAQAFFYDEIHRDFLDETHALYVALGDKDAESGELRTIIHNATSQFEEKKRAFEDRISGLHDTTVKLSEQQIRINDKVFKIHKTLREAGDEYLAAKRKVLHETSKEYAYLEHRLNLFIDLVGNHPLDHYKLEHLTRFATSLKYIPANHSVKPEWRHMSIAEIISINKTAGRLRADKGLSQKTIVVNYVGKIKTIFRYVCANENIPNPFKESSALIPKVDKQSLKRRPLPIGSIKELFYHCVKSDRADEFFLPVLGALTGARLSELVYLQGRNIVDRHGRGHYTANLISAIITDEGEHVRRPTKNDASSLRFIVLHDTLEEIGFIEWAKSRPHWLFPELHTKIIKRPGDTASKRFQRIFRQIDIHEDRTEVFHSLRHYYKDWVRACHVPDRTIDIQTGHAMASVGQRYGSQHLRPDEVDLLATCSIPKELDVLLDPYRKRKLFNVAVPREPIKKRRSPRRPRLTSTAIVVTSSQSGRY